VCGSCSVLLDDELVCACLVPAVGCSGRTITTVVGVCRHPLGARLEHAFAITGAVQCGFCTPGFVVAAFAVLSHGALPSDERLGEELAGNLCRCTGYGKILASVRHAGTRE
jgi:carbon-monoxide dehydrogenase small subunit